jgi:hypothetical protein
MVYNEPDFLPVWAAHYRAQVGAEHCYVIDHGSDDGSVNSAGPYQIARLPRSALNEDWRSNLVSQICSQLLDRYNAVAYADVDELLVADPRHYRNLIHLSATAEPHVLTAFGTNMLHTPGEAPINLSQPITRQRSWTRPFSSLCKPALIRRPIRWRPGFHIADATTEFGGLYLFHIAYVDNEITGRRQEKRRRVERSPGHGAHHATEPTEMIRLMTACASLPRDPASKLGGDAEARFIADLQNAARPAPGGWVISSDRESPVLWAMPSWLEGVF